MSARRAGAASDGAASGHGSRRLIVARWRSATVGEHPGLVSISEFGKHGRAHLRLDQKIFKTNSEKKVSQRLRGIQTPRNRREILRATRSKDVDLP